VAAEETDVLSVWRRQMELPRFLRAVEGGGELARALSDITGELGFANVTVVSGTSITKELAQPIVSGLPNAAGPLCVLDNSQQQVDKLAGARELRDADAVIAVGGGKTIDVAKSACDQLDLPVIVVPTQLTADGIASPVSVIQAHPGRSDSRRARLPIGLVVDFDVLARSPVESARAGLGDLIANGCAVRDWRLAATRGHETVDDFAALLAEAASDLVMGTDVSSLIEGPLERGFLHRLLQGLVLSGLAMEIAGSSRPCSGAEHLISHALDRLHPGTAAHGEQVAFGAIVCARLQGEDWRGLAALLRSAGLERAARGFGLPADEIVAAIGAAPQTRPGRYTILDESDLGQEALGSVVREVLAEPAGTA
jgi:glycerol-1-phosphate dehydrogenase [NAD(P)+]